MTTSLLPEVETTLMPFSAIRCIDARAVLVLAPHPDDEVFGCGGAIASHILAGTPVQVVVMTDGGKGGCSTERYAESTAAAQVLGYGQPIFWGLPDRGVQWSESLLQRMCAVLVEGAVDLLYAPSPWELHPDHRQAAVLAMQAVRCLRDSGIRIAFYEVSAPLRPNMLLDITPNVEIKTRAMRCFTSQLEQQDYLEQVLALNRFRTYTLPMETRFAEAYSLHDYASVERHLANGFFRSPAIKSYPDGLHADRVMPLVSVLVRSMDRSYLAQALESVALQTYPNVEVIVVAATAAHQDLPSYCGTFPMRLVRSECALPRSQAANQALAQAAGEYLLLLDDDDWLMPDHIERLACALTNSPNAPAVYTGVSLADVNGKPLGQMFDMPYDGIQQLAGNLTPIHSVLFRAKIVQSGCRFDESLDRYEDWDFWLQLSRHGTMVHLPGVSAIYRIHESSGVHVDAGPLGASAQAIYQKWRSTWTTQELGAMMLRVWSYYEMEGQLEDFKRQDVQLRALFQQHVDAMSEQVEQIGTMLLELNTRQQKIETLSTQIGEQHTQIDKQRMQIGTLNTQIGQHQTHTEELTNQFNKMTAAFHLINAEMLLLQKSRSWRITRPLRWLAGILRNENAARDQGDMH